MNERTFAEWLKARLKEDRDLNQSRLAEVVGVSRSTVSNWVLGKFYPSDTNIEVLCSLFREDKSNIYKLIGKLEEPDAEPSPLSPETESIVRLLESIPSGPIRRAALMAAREVLLAFVKLLDSDANDRAA